MSLTAKKYTLLTGAGLTKNFGGFLGQEMWAKIFNQPRIQRNKIIRGKLLSNYDYEKVYGEVLNDLNCSEKDRADFTEALSEVYEEMERILASNNASSRIKFSNFQEQFLNRFIGQRNEPSFFFTLNQDLFVERHQQGQPPFFPFVSLGIQYESPLNTPIRNEFSLNPADYKNVSRAISPPEKETYLNSASSFYIKLHGSFNWRGADEKSIVITGPYKLSSILAIPLLEWYWELFNGVLRQNNMRLLIIGYGFLDPHINRTINEAVLKNGLKIFILDPQPVGKMEGVINQAGMTAAWKKGLGGYFQSTLAEMFPPTNQSRTEKTSTMRDIEECFFETAASFVT